MVLYDCMQDFNSDRNKQHKILKLSETINQATFKKNYPGGLRGFIDYLCSQWTLIDCEDPQFEWHPEVSDLMKMSTINTKLAAMTEIHPVSHITLQNTMKSTGTLEEYVEVMLTYA
jgi:hypothetical protein